MLGFAAPAARAAYRELGLRGIEGYVWGRAAALGEPSASVVVAAFGVFAPRLVTEAYESARARVSRAAVLQAREHGAKAALSEVVPDATAVAPIGDVILDAAEGLDATGRPLFSGLRELHLPTDPYVRLWRAAELVREHRGDGHLAACLVAGLDVVEMNVLTELWVGYDIGEYSGTRGHSPVHIQGAVARLRRRGWVHDASLTAAGTDARVAIEEATDRSQQALMDALGDRLEWVIKAASEIGDAVVRSGGLAADPRKRAAG
jgi:hypothetical protein